VAFYTGKSGRVTIGVTVYKVTDWSGDLEAQLLRTTNSESAGYEESESGIYSGEVVINCNFEVGTAPLSTLAFSPGGGNVTAVVLRVGTAAGPNFSGNIRWSRFRVDNQVEGLVPITIVGRFTGTITSSSM
jgi:hypothetical protein